MVKVVGFKRSTGTFTNKSTGELIVYDNINLYVIQSVNSDANLHGLMCDIIKLKYECAPAVLGLPEKDWDSLIGKEVLLEYTGGRYPRLESVKFVTK